MWFPAFAISWGRRSPSTHALLWLFEPFPRLSSPLTSKSVHLRRHELTLVRLNVTGHAQLRHPNAVPLLDPPTASATGEGWTMQNGGKETARWRICKYRLSPVIGAWK